MKSFLSLRLYKGFKVFRLNSFCIKSFMNYKCVQFMKRSHNKHQKIFVAKSRTIQSYLNFLQKHFVLFGTDLIQKL